jgi:hypothetical protein
VAAAERGTALRAGGARRPARARGTLCPVCVRPTRHGRCREHGPWQSHQLVSTLDRRRAGRATWQPFEPSLHACPRCLGDVAESRDGFECLEHAHAADGHGPYRVDELLGPTAQREAALARDRLARRYRRVVQPAVSVSLPSLPDVTQALRILIAAALVVATLAFLVR